MGAFAHFFVLARIKAPHWFEAVSRGDGAASGGSIFGKMMGKGAQLAKGPAWCRGAFVF